MTSEKRINRIRKRGWQTAYAFPRIPRGCVLCGKDSDHYEIDSEQWFGPDGIVISGDNIQVQGGEYRYRLVLNAKDGFVFDNSLNGFEYQGVNGDYSLHYDFGGENQNDNHTLIVTGVFSNIISAVNLANINSDDIARLIALVITGTGKKTEPSGDTGGSPLAPGTSAARTTSRRDWP